MAADIFRHTRNAASCLMASLAAAFFLLSQLASADTLLSVQLEDVDSGLTSPQGNYRWMDVADHVYAQDYQDSYNYTQASVTVDFYTDATTLHGTLAASTILLVVLAAVGAT